MTKGERGTLAWVTGGGTGIGLESARVLGRAGYHVALSGRREAELAAAVAALRADGINAEAVPLDVADLAAVANAGADLVARHGAVAVLVCSAGTNVPKRFWRDLSPADFARVVGVNLNGVAACVCAVLPAMRERGGGTIVVISSWAGWRYLGFTGAAYGASKQGLSPLVETLNDQEGAHGIRATLICPGEVATPILRSRPVPPPEEEIARMLQPDDVAAAVLFAAQAPARVCVNEIVISPTHNRIYVGADDLKQPRP